MGLDRIALISDVHGNLTALEAVLADIEGRGIERLCERFAWLVNWTRL